MITFLIAIETLHFVNLITIIAVGIGIIFFVISIFFGYNWFSAVIYINNTVCVESVSCTCFVL